MVLFVILSWFMEAEQIPIIGYYEIRYKGCYPGYYEPAKLKGLS